LNSIRRYVVSAVHHRRSDFSRVSALTLGSYEGGLASALINPVGGYAYFGMWSDLGAVVKIRLSTFMLEGALYLDSGEAYFNYAVIDPGAGFAYFGTLTTPGRVIKVGCLA